MIRATVLLASILALALPAAAQSQDRPPIPSECGDAAASAATDYLLDYAAEVYPSFYEGGSPVEWFYDPTCRDLTGDGDPELILILRCCTGGSLTPWAIFKHDAAGQWVRVYARVRDNTHYFRVQGSGVITKVPARYEGACTHIYRTRVVRWNGAAFAGKLGSARRERRSRGCR